MGLSEYVVEGLVACGGFSEVLLGKDHFGNQVAIKRIPKKVGGEIFRAREIEANKLVSSHPSIAKFHTYFEDDFYLYLVFDFIKGKDLQEAMETRNYSAFPEKVSMSIFIQLLNALRYSHQQGVFHRDIKLENIRMTDEGVVKLIDFGLCHIGNGQCNDDVGSLDYAAPELLAMKPYFADKADVWALGTVLFILIFGELPFLASQRLEFLKHERSQHPVLPEELEIQVPGSVQQLLGRMLDLNPETRISIQEIASHPWVNSHWKPRESRPITVEKFERTA